MTAKQTFKYWHIGVSVTGNSRTKDPPRTLSERRVSRILLIGQDFHDSVIDSYRRSLAPHYEVRVENPFNLVPGLGRFLRTGAISRINVLMRQLSNSALREPLALSEHRILKCFTAHSPDIVLIDCIDSLRPKVLAKFRTIKPDTIIMGVYSDPIASFGRGYFFAASYDRLFFKDRYIVELLQKKLGWKHAFYLPQACDKYLHNKVELSAEDLEKYGCDISLAGSGYLYRAEMLKPLIGTDIRIWGPTPPRWFEHPTRSLFAGEYVAGIEKSKAMLASKIVINPNHYSEIAGTNKRTFEVAAIGAFQLTDTPALREVFEPDQEVGYFESGEEMVSKIRYYLGQPNLRLEMANRARHRAHSEHTYEHRWTAKLLTLGILPPQQFSVQPDDVAVLAE